MLTLKEATFWLIAFCIVLVGVIVYYLQRPEEPKRWSPVHIDRTNKSDRETPI